MKTTDNINIKSSRNKRECFQRKKVHNYLQLILRKYTIQYFAIVIPIFEKILIVDFAAAQGNPESTAARHKSRTDSTNDNRKRIFLNNPSRKFNTRKPNNLKGRNRKDNGDIYHEIYRRQMKVYTQFSKIRSTSKTSKAPPKKKTAKTNKVSQIEDNIEMEQIGQDWINDDKLLHSIEEEISTSNKNIMIPTESVNTEDKYLISIKNPSSNTWGLPDSSQYRTTSPSYSIEEEIPTSNKNIMIPKESVDAKDKYLIPIKNPSSNTWGTPDESISTSHESVPSALNYLPFSSAPSEIQIKRPTLGSMQILFNHPPLEVHLESVDFTPFILQIATTSSLLLKEEAYFLDETKLYMEREYINYFENEYKTSFGINTGFNYISLDPNCRDKTNGGLLFLTECLFTGNAWFILPRSVPPNIVLDQLNFNLFNGNEQFEYLSILNRVKNPNKVVNVSYTIYQEKSKEMTQIEVEDLIKATSTPISTYLLISFTMVLTGVALIVVSFGSNRQQESKEEEQGACIIDISRMESMSDMSDMAQSISILSDK